MKKVGIIILVITSLIILTIVSFFVADNIRVKKMLDPAFCIRKQELNDGGSTEFIGLGYKVFKYVDCTEEQGFYTREIFVTSIFDKFNKPNYEAQRRIAQLVELKNRAETELKKVTLYNFYNGIEELNYSDNKDIIDAIINDLIKQYEDDDKFSKIDYSAKTTVCIYFDFLGDLTNYVIDKTNIEAINELNKIQNKYNELTISSDEVSKMTITRYSDEQTLNITDKEQKQLIFDSCVDSTDANDVMQVYMKAKKRDGKYVDIYSTYKFEEVPDNIKQLFENKKAN